MQHFCIYSVLLALFLVICYFGDTQAKVTINVPGTIPSGQPTSGSCVVSGNMYSRRPPYFFIRVKLVGNNNEADCSIECIGRFYELGRAHYGQNFNIICNHGNSVGIQCFTHINNEITKVSVQVTKPKITSKSSNITTNIGLPVTLTCYVEGDPNHYWVGWMHRNTIVQPGEEHSISTSPNFRSRNGTTHHLTIHSIKIPGKYECKVYSITGDCQDQVSHQVLVSEESHEKISLTSSSSSSLFNILSSLFF